LESVSLLGSLDVKTSAAARCRLKETKAAALAMAKGAGGDYRLGNPIGHLNGLAARMLDREVA
jgi:hypothetical protein